MGFFSKKEDKTSDLGYFDDLAKHHPIEMIKRIWKGEEAEKSFALASKIKTSNIADNIDLLFDIKHILADFEKLVDKKGPELLFKGDGSCWIVCKEADTFANATVVANAFYENIFGKEIADRISSIGCFSTAYVLALWGIDDAIRENDLFRAIINNPKFMNIYTNTYNDNVAFYLLYNNGYALNQDIINLDYINSDDSVIWNKKVFARKYNDKIIEYDIRLANDKELRKKALYKEDGSVRELDTIEYYLNKERPELIIKDI